MARFMIRRLIEAALAILSVAAMVFVLYHLIHESPAYAMLYPDATPAKVAQLNAELGLNLPIPVQFFLWLKQAVIHGGFVPIVTQYLPPTVELLGLGVLWAFGLSILTAMTQIRYAGTVIDRILDAITSIFSVVPGFWLGTLVLFLFAMNWAVFPGLGFPTPHHGFFYWLYCEILPSMTLALTTMGSWTRQLRASLEESLRTDYVRTARAKGVPEGRVRWRHMLRNSILPFISLAGMSMPTMLNTVIALEIIFTVPGMGTQLVQSLVMLSFNGATTIAMVLSMVTILGSVLADFTYGIVDPRITYR
jgi:peptide/nickel transport system permease protein